MGKETFDLCLPQGGQTKASRSHSRSLSLLAIAPPLPSSFLSLHGGGLGWRVQGCFGTVWGLTVQPVMRQTTTVELWDARWMEVREVPFHGCQFFS